MISSALEAGVIADTAAVHALQTALESSLGKLDSDLSAARDDIINTISGIAAKVTPAELAKAFKGITDAIDSHSQSIADILAAIKKIVKDLEAEAGVPSTLACDQSLTTRSLANFSRSVFVLPSSKRT